MDKRPWYDERHLFDAPEEYGHDESKAWAAGWNAAVAEFTHQSNLAFLQELGQSHPTPFGGEQGCRSAALGPDENETERNSNA